MMGFYIFLALLVGIVFWRIILPSLKPGFKKTGTSGTYAPTPPTPPGGPFEKWYSKYMKYSWTIVLSLAGAAVFYLWVYTPGLRFSQVGEWSWDHWLSLPAFAGIVLALIKLNEKPLGDLVKMLQGGLVGAMLLMYLGIPAGLWVRDVFLPKVFCDDGNPSELTFCKLNTAWSSWFRGKGADGMNLCYDPPGQVEHDYTEKDGTSFYRLRSKEGIVEAKYIFKKMPPDAKKCPKI